MVPLWLGWSSPSSAYEFTLLVKSVCRVFSCIVGRGCLLWPVCSLGKTLLAFALLHFVLQGQTWMLLQVSLEFLLLSFSPLWWKGYLLWILVLEGLIGLHRTIQCQLLQHYWLGHRLDYCDIEWLVSETSIDHSFTFEVAPKYCIWLFCWLWKLLHFF